MKYTDADLKRIEERIADKPKKHQCICPDKHETENFFDSCANVLSEWPICGRCSAVCHSGEVVNYAIKEGFLSEDEASSWTKDQVKAYVDKCDMVQPEDFV